MIRTGEILRKEREARGLSIHEIGLSLKINSKILKAIEEGDATKLPAKTFLRGFVQSYASYLKLNVEDVLKVFTEEMGTTRPQPVIKDGVKDPTKDDQASVDVPVIELPVTPLIIAEPKGKFDKKASLEETSTTKGLIFALIGVFLAGFILITMKVIEKYQREAQVGTVDVKPIEDEQAPIKPVLPVEVTDANSSAANSMSTDKVPAVTAAPPTVQPTNQTPPVSTTPVVVTTPAPAPIEKMPEQPVAASPPPKQLDLKKDALKNEEAAKAAKKAEALAAEEKAKAEREKAADEAKAAEARAAEQKALEAKAEEKRLADKKAEEKKLEEKKTAEKKTEKASEEKNSKPIELIIEALDNVEIEYASGTGKPETIQLGPEQIHTFKSKSGLKLNISNGGAVNIILNGKDLSVPGDLGKPIKLTY
jgi:cytoskeleton protein RodZ